MYYIGLRRLEAFRSCSEHSKHYNLIHYSQTGQGHGEPLVSEVPSTTVWGLGAQRATQAIPNITTLYDENNAELASTHDWLKCLAKGG